MNQTLQNSVMQKQQRLCSEEIPHVIATVVRTNSSTAAKPGMKALVLENGEFEGGWLGGGCVTSAVRRAAKESIQTGEAILVCMRPEELIDEDTNTDMVTLARNGCPSKGSLDIFVEPIIPLPELIVFGNGPVALSLLYIARGFGFKLTVCGKADGQDLNVDNCFSTPSEMEQYIRSSANKYIVVATQGLGDVASLICALSIDHSYVSFVGSRRKFASYEKKLLDAGISPKTLKKVFSPAGLNIHAVTPEEIALSIMAEIVDTRRMKKEVAL